MRSWKGWDTMKFSGKSKRTTYFGVERRVLEPKLSPPTSRKPGCGDGCGWWIQISSLQNHSLYSQWDIGRVELMWIARISPNSLNLDVKSGRGPSQVCPHPWLKNMLWWPFQSPYTNLNLLQPFIILMMRSWKGQVGVKFFNQSKHTPS